MRTPAEYLASVLDLCQPLPATGVALGDAIGCVLAEGVKAGFPLPSFDNSAMDGFAVRAADTASASEASPVELRIVDDVPAGAFSEFELLPGTAIRIMTGAPLPVGADTVVPVEVTRSHGDGVEIQQASTAGQYVRRAGEDIRAGELALTAGVVVGVRELALLAALGVASVLVHPRPRVAIIPTGDELTPIGEPLTRAGIYDSNGPMLAAQLRAMGAAVDLHTAVSDGDSMFRDALLAAAASSDLVVTSGGISMGNRDVVKEVLTEIGGVRFEKIAMQPGMPQGCGKVNGTPVVTLPGNPVSSYISAELFVRPALRRQQGRIELQRPTRTATCIEAFSSPAEKEQYVRAVIAGQDTLTARPVGRQGSHVLGGLAAANALIRVPIGVSQIADGELVEVIDLREDR